MVQGRRVAPTPKVRTPTCFTPIGRYLGASALTTHFLKPVLLVYVLLIAIAMPVSPYSNQQLQMGRTALLESPEEIKEGTDRLMRGRTTFVIAHRLSTIQGADRVVVLDGGEVVEQGGHAELVARGGLYHRLVERQFAH